MILIFFPPLNDSAKSLTALLRESVFSCLDTIKTMVEAGAKAIALEAGKTLLVEKEKVVALADANDITIVAM